MNTEFPRHPSTLGPRFVKPPVVDAKAPILEIEENERDAMVSRTYCTKPIKTAAYFFLLMIDSSGKIFLQDGNDAIWQLVHLLECEGSRASSSAKTAIAANSMYV